MSRYPEIEEALSSLPENIKQAVEAFDWAEEILHIARQYGLQIDDVDVFREETMLVIVGLESAKDYKNNLKERMRIRDDLAETLVFEANNRIFKELQKRAFGPENPLEQRAHEEIHDTLHDEGIHLVDEKEEIEEEHEDIIPETPVPPQSLYHEAITEDDLRGVGGYHIDLKTARQERKPSPGTILEEKEADLGIDDKETLQMLDKKLFESPMITKGDTVDVSPSETEQLKEDKEFLDAIKKSV